MDLNNTLIPVARAKLERLACSHVVHDLLNVPWLVAVAGGVVGGHTLVVFESDVLLHAVDNVVVVLVGVVFGVVAPDPAWELGGCAAGVQLDLFPVGFLEELGVAEAELLSTGVADESGRGNVSIVLGVRGCV